MSIYILRSFRSIYASAAKHKKLVTILPLSEIVIRLGIRISLTYLSAIELVIRLNMKYKTPWELSGNEHTIFSSLLLWRTPECGFSLAPPPLQFNSKLLHVERACQPSSRFPPENTLRILKCDMQIRSHNVQAMSICVFSHLLFQDSWIPILASLRSPLSVSSFRFGLSRDAEETAMLRKIICRAWKTAICNIPSERKELHATCY